MKTPRRSCHFAFAILAALLANNGMAQNLPSAEAAPDAAPLIAAGPSPIRLAGPLTIAVAGDLLYSHPVVPTAPPTLTRVFELLRGADLAIANQEVPLFDLRLFRGAPAEQGLLLGRPTVAVDERKIGIGMVSLANNHAADWGTEGLLETIKLLDAAGIAHAGAGQNLSDARAATMVDTGKGRVALVAAASTFKPGSMANDAFDDMPARSGISVLHTQKIVPVGPAELNSLRAIAGRQSYGRMAPPAADAREVRLDDTLYRLSSQGELEYDINPYDRYGILAAIGDARKKADVTIFTMHAHESPTGLDDDNPNPPAFVQAFYRNAVDAGADVVVGGGPHSLRGIEIYKGRPIFYGVGTLFLTGEIYLTQETLQNLAFESTESKAGPNPHDVPRAVGGNPRDWYRGIVALVDMNKGSVLRVRLYPLDLGADKDRPQRGVPRLAAPALARKILEKLAQDSSTFHTQIRIEGSVGVIDIASKKGG